jgi:hypothetical protein
MEAPSQPRTAARAVIVAALLAWGTLASILALRLSGKALDDFFITYRYALHLARGQGFVFNLGERVFGLTDPGFALLLAAAARTTGLAVPALATLFFAVSLVALAGLLLSAAAPAGRLPEALAAGSLLLLSSYVWAQQGGEIVPMLALLAAAAELGRRRPVLAGLLAGAAVWFRPEAGLGVAILCLLLWAETRVLPWRLAVAAAATIAVGGLAALGYFGTLLPNSLAAKHAMAEGVADSWAGPTRFWLRSARLVPRHGGDLWRLLVILGAAGQVPLFAAGGRAARLLVLLALSLTVLYPAIGVPFFPWYILPMVVAVLYGVPFLAGAAVRWLWHPSSLPRRAAAVLAGCLLAVPALFSLVPASYRWHRNFHWPPYMERYRAAGEWLAASSPPQASVAYYEVGALGYYSERTVVDLLGIVTPEVLPYVRRGDLHGAFLARPADYAVFDGARGGLMPVAAPWFTAAYVPAARIDQLVIFRRRPGVALPAPDSPRR